jgi:Invasion associated locus B (IalB) protein
MPIFRHLVFRKWRLGLSLLGAAAFATPGLAQQPADQSVPPPPGATMPATPATPAPPKRHKHKAATAPVAEGTTPAAPPAAATGGVKPTLLGQYGDWGAYTATPGGKKICFAIAKASTSETDPPGKSRNPPYLFVSTRPTDKVNNELSITIGYPFKPSSEATVDVGSSSFALYTQQDGAWIKNAAEETHLVDAMRTAQNAVVKGMSARGTHSTDTFSLRGFAQALDRSDQDCK